MGLTKGHKNLLNPDRDLDRQSGLLLQYFASNECVYDGRYGMGTSTVQYHLFDCLLFRILRIQDNYNIFTEKYATASLLR